VDRPPRERKSEVGDQRTWERDLQGLPRLIPHFELDHRHTALLVIDMQHSMGSRSCGVGAYLIEKFPAVAEYFLPRVEQVVVPNVRRLLEVFRARHLRVIYITVGPELPDGADYFPLRRAVDDQIQAEVGHKTAAFVRGSPEHAILEAVRPIEGELVVNKITRSPFTSTGLDQILRHLGITTLVIVGMNTDVCVETTGRDAADRGYRCVLVADACAAFSQASHEASLKAFAGIFGRVELCADVVTEFAKALD
jgi:nicotinamidase-related amidase